MAVSLGAPTTASGLRPKPVRSGRSWAPGVTVVVLASVLWPIPAMGADAGPDRSHAEGGLPRSEPGFSGVQVVLDEDWLFGFANTDRNYTMGIGVSVSGDFIRTSLVSKPSEWMDLLFGTQALHELLARSSTDQDRLFGHSLTLLGAGFTPRNLTLIEPDRTDRPYASIIQLEVARTTVDARHRQLLRTALGIGVLGTDLARAVQSYIHERSLELDPNNAPVPLGWHNQISQGGELTVLYSLAYSRELSRSVVHDLSGQLDGSLGYYSGLSGGLMLRLGLLRSAFWNTPVNPLSEADGLPAGPYAAGPTGRFELYAYGAIRGRVVLYNALLQGQFRDSVYTLRADEVSRIVNEVETGAVVAFCGFSVTAAVASVRSPEHFVSQMRSHIWGGIHVSYQVLQEGGECRP